jgi:hypothetical protein
MEQLLFKEKVNYMQKIKNKILKKQLLAILFMFFLFSFFNFSFDKKNNNVFAACKDVDPDTGYCNDSLPTNTSTLRSLLNTSTTTAGADCGSSGFQKIGGICFPTSSQTGLSDANVTTILTNLLSWLLGIFGILSIMAFVISGIQYLSSAGSDDMIKTAKKNMTWSIVGVLVGLSGYVIINAIANALSGSSITY